MNRLVIKSCFVAVTMSAVLSVHGTTLCEGTSTPVLLNLASGIRTAAMTEMVCYSTAWVDGAASGATAVVAVNGERRHVDAGAKWNLYADAQGDVGWRTDW